MPTSYPELPSRSGCAHEGPCSRVGGWLRKKASCIRWTTCRASFEETVGENYSPIQMAELHNTTRQKVASATLYDGAGCMGDQQRCRVRGSIVYMHVAREPLEDEASRRIDLQPVCSGLLCDVIPATYHHRQLAGSNTGTVAGYLA